MADISKIILPNGDQHTIKDSTARSGLNNKVDKVSGKGLSTNDFTDVMESKLNGIAAGAEVNVQADWNETNTSSDAYIKNKPTIPTDTDTWKVYYGTCTTAAGTRAKTVTVSAGQSFSLRVGVIVGVKFSNSNTYSNVTSSPITLNVNSTGAKNIWYNTTHSGAGNTGTSTNAYGYAGCTSYYMYDGTYWVWVSHGVDNNTTYTAASATPLMDDTGAVGTSAKYAREDHVHPSDTSKVDKVEGKGLSTNDFTDALETKLNGIAAGAEVNVQSDWNETNTSSDAFIKNKPTIPTKTSDLTNDSDFVSDANYVHTDNNFTTTLKNKLNGIATGAEVNVQADWNVTDTTSDAYIKNKPTISADTWKVFYGTCSTAAGTAAKVVSVSADQNFSLITGVVVGIKFSYSNTASNVTLNVNSTGAKSIWYNTAVYTGNGNGVAGYANRTYYYMYNGTNWLMLSTGLINENTYDRTYLSNSGYKAKSAITAGNIIVAGSDGLYFHLKSGAAFDITQPILYTSSACNAGATNNSGYIITSFSVKITQSITLTAYKPVYIKGHLEGTTFTPSGTSPLTQTEPTTADGYKYLLLGRACNSTTVMYLLPEHPIFERTSDAAWGTFHPMHVPLSNSFTYTGVGEAALDAVAGKTLFEYFKQLVRIIAVEKTSVTCNSGAGYVDIPFTVTMLTPTFTTLAVYVNSTPNSQWIMAQPQVFHGDGTNPFVRVNYYNHYSSPITGTFKVLVLYSNYEGIYN